MATTPPKPPTLTPQQQRTLAANAAAQRQAAAERAKSTAMQNQARQIANTYRLYSYTQPTKEDLAKANALRRENTRYVFSPDKDYQTPTGYVSGPAWASHATAAGYRGELPEDIARQISQLTMPKLVTDTSKGVSIYTDPSNPNYNPYVKGLQTQDLIRAEQRGHDYQTAADGTVYDVATPEGKKEFDENNAYWKSMGGYNGVKKGGVIKKKAEPKKPVKASKPTQTTKKYAAGGCISAKKADGIASRGHTKCKMR